MKIWWRKIAVVFITILTLGIYTPTSLLEVDADEQNDRDMASSSGVETPPSVAEVPQPYIAEDSRETFLKQLHEEAKERSLEKFGPRIAEKVEEEFIEVILPQIETVLADLVEHSPAYKDIVLTENPSDGYGERIFNVSNRQTNQKLAKFHVRRENRPLDGHYFNFHYHLYADRFQKHYTIGTIYWDKNTPPKWMA